MVNKYSNNGNLPIFRRDENERNVVQTVPHCSRVRQSTQCKEGNLDTSIPTKNCSQVQKKTINKKVKKRKIKIIIVG